MDEPILGEGEEGPSIGEEGGVWVEGDRIKCSPLVGGPLDGQVAVLQPLLEHLEQKLPPVPGQLMLSGGDGGRVLRQADGSTWDTKSAQGL